ncbi:Oidioi.mRNA.OKI2018_I69.PAR.g12032.t1.cds [Oikopleura dioica]|uniref:Oidioi.mRNA.OKI2018_I69.PAR.g12032.t1.cds n=1 Tax=Oikopleura dioica TaxID=34765 RepID=A0ABN7RYZ7_OIKDI|nr:Oidioi.mRNA.OKI2018_I69.PAR.g12032.t1.cds [Oikopleura dioica]
MQSWSRFIRTPSERTDNLKREERVFFISALPSNSSRSTSENSSYYVSLHKSDSIKWSMPCPIKLLENYQKVKQLEKSALSTKENLSKGYTMFFNENSRKNSQGVQVETSSNLAKCARNGDKVRQAKEHFDFEVQSEAKSQQNFEALQNISSILQNRPEFLELVTSRKKVSPEKMRPRPTYRDFLPNRISSNATLMNSSPNVPPHVVTWIHSGGQTSFNHAQRVPKVYQLQPGFRDEEEEEDSAHKRKKGDNVAKAGLTRLIKMCGKCFGDESDDSSSGGSSSEEGSDGGSDDDDDDADGGDEVSLDDDSGGGDSGSDDDDGDGDDDSIDTDALDDDIANDQWNNMDGDNMDGGSVDGGMSMGSDFSDSLTELRAGGRNFFGEIR